MLPSEGPLAWSDITNELVWPTSKPLPLNAPEVYALIGKAPGSIICFPDDFYGRAFLDIIPDDIAWNDLIGDNRTNGVPRTFTGLAHGVAIDILVSVDTHEADFAVIDIIRNGEVVGSIELQGSSKTDPVSVKVLNATKLAFAARSVSNSPAEAVVRITNASFHNADLASFVVRLT